MKKTVLLGVLFLLQLNSYSQGNLKTRKWRTSEVDSLNKAQLLFEEQNYLMALPIYEKLQENHPKELYLKYVTGICGLYRSDEHEKALTFLLEVYDKNKKVPDIDYDVARAYHFNYKFDEALTLLNSYLEKPKITPQQRKDAELLVGYCNHAKELVADPVDANIENIGDIVNTSASEYVPVISSDESVMIYTYRGDQSVGGLQNAYGQPDPLGVYYEDVFMTHKENGEWVTPYSIGSNINTPAHDAAIAISNDGQKLFIFKDNSYDGGDIYVSQLDSSSWSTPEKLQGEVNSASWEGSASLSADEKTLYFSSERPGGYGGRDIYTATKLADGSWGNVHNMGKNINTPYDDDAPFIHPDGISLIFSSRGWNSMGSYDIFQSKYNPLDSSWSTPKNLGYPINTPDDDRYFVLSADGKRGYYASGKSGGYGLHDIYVVEMPTNFIDANLLLVKGTVTLDSMPVLAEVSVVNETNASYAQLKSNALTGAYLVNLQAGHDYTLRYSLKGFPAQTTLISCKDLKGYQEKTVDIHFYSKHDSLSVGDSIQQPTTLEKVDSLPKAPLTLEERIGGSSLEGLEFRVQIAAYNLPKNYSYDHLKGLGKVEKMLLEDGITRFTIGGVFNNLNDANVHLKKVRAAGQNDAFVTAIYKGKRVYLEDLEKLGLIPATQK